MSNPWLTILISLAALVAGMGIILTLNWYRNRTPATKRIIMPAIPFDKDNLPRKMYYKPKADRPPAKCFCHERELKTGEEIMWWPMPDSDEVRLFCSELIAEVSAEDQ